MTVEAYFAAYQQYHHDQRNKITHYLGIPLIIYALLNFLCQIPSPIPPVGGVALDWALVSLLGVLVFYATLSWRLAIAMAVLTAPAYVLARFTPWPAGVSAFVAGWALQLIGHRFEGKKPAFLKNGVHLLIGPLWIASHLMTKVGLWPPRSAHAPRQPTAAAE